MNSIEQKCVAAYREHKHLKLAARDVGIPWQTLYVHLRKAGEPVTGDKARYGSHTDKFAAKAEAAFLALVPEAKDQNRRTFQSKVDFLVNGYSVDVKASSLRALGKSARRWSFSLKKQEMLADFFVCMAYRDGGQLYRCLLVPGEIARHYSSISLGGDLNGKWGEYVVVPQDLRAFFSALPEKAG